MTRKRAHISCEDDAPLAIDLFCGSGAVSVALKANGFRVVAAVDNDRTCAETYGLNHPEVPFREKDIRKIEPAELAVALPEGKQLELMVVCAPCQPFSSQNRRREDVDPRAPLMLHAVRLAKALQPRLIMFENVPGIASSPMLERLRRALFAAGYQMGEPARIDAADFGVPQRRVRCIVVASRSSALVPPSVPAAPRKYGVTVRKAFAGLTELGSGEADPSDPLHVSRKHQQLTLTRLELIPRDGGSRCSLPKQLQLACHRKCGPGEFSDVYGRMRWDAVAPTLTTGCTDVTRGRFAHPQENRAITLREAARLQTFPDDYKFAGSRSEIAAQIGNAVPIELARRLIEGLLISNPSPLS